MREMAMTTPASPGPANKERKLRDRFKGSRVNQGRWKNREEIGGEPNSTAAGEPKRRGRGRVIGVVLLTLLFSGNPAAAKGPDEEAVQRAAREIYGLVMCPLCAGQTIAQSSNETSRQMRDLVVKKLRQGKSKEDILKYFKGRYGERILARPDKRGFNLILWVFPYVMVAFAVIAIYFLIRRWASPAVADSAVSSNNEALSMYKERVEKELRAFRDDSSD